MTSGFTQQRMMTIAKVLGILLLLYFVTLHWWFTAPFHALGQERDSLLDSQRKMQQELQQQDGIQQRLAQLQQTSPALETWMNGDSGMVAAQLGQQLDVWLVASPVTCQALTRTPGAEQRSGRFRKTVMQVRLRCSMQGLVSLMERIEAESPALFIENLEIATRRHMAAVGDQNAGLDVTLDIAVYSRLASGLK